VLLSACCEKKVHRGLTPENVEEVGK